jgi:hypothetical protein
MRRLLSFLLCLALALAFAVTPAAACINDSEVLTAEREFQSQYADPPAVPVAPNTSTPSVGEQVRLYGPLTLGGLLLVGAFVQTWRRPGPRG